MKITLSSILNRKPTVYDTRPFVAALFREDGADNDLTTRCTAPNRRNVTAKIIAKEAGVLAGLDVMKEIFHFRDRSLRIHTDFHEGDAVKEKDTVCVVRGRTASILQSERVALNVLQRMSGVATEAKKLCSLVSGTKAKLLNTRKTIPGMRYLEKYASTVGGAVNHRLSLSDGILIKENHIMAAGSLKQAVLEAWKRKPANILIEVEVKNLRELREALDLPVDLVMLDNFDPATVRKAVRMTAGRKPLEVSGNVRAGNIRTYALAGVDYISVGAITHSAHALDFSLLVYDEYYD
jgi:nicotinate-nucleotide pyrophosphorylase (carboxylating)